MKLHRQHSASPPPSAGLVPLAELYACFEYPRAARRWCDALPAHQRSRDGARLLVTRRARLPDGRSVQAALHELRLPPRELVVGQIAPPGAERWSDRDRQRFAASHELARRLSETRSRFPSRTFEQCAAIVQAEHAAWLASVNLSAAPSTLRRMLRRLDPQSDCFDGNVDTRGRLRGVAKLGVGADGEIKRQPALIDPAAWSRFCELYLTQQSRDLKRCWLRVQIEAEQRGWFWPSESSIRRKVRDELSQPDLILARRGPRAHEANCVPKIERNYEDLPANHTWSGDQRTLDQLVRVYRGGKYLAVRPILTAWLDVRSRLFVGWTLGLRGNSDTILHAFHDAALAHGLPRCVYIDNGRDYRSLGGRVVAAERDAHDQQRVAGVFANMGVEVTYATAYHPWAKMIESHFRALKDDFDRDFPSFRGGTPQERPEQAAEVATDLASLPTLDELRSALTNWFAQRAERPQFGSGTFNLCPRELMARYQEERRTVADPSVLRLLCSRTVGPLKVGRDGLRLEGVSYGRFDSDVHRLQGQSVYALLDPQWADRLTLCDRNGRPLLGRSGQPVVANASRAVNAATRDDHRAVIAQQAKLRRQARQVAAQRDALHRTTEQQLAVNLRDQRTPRPLVAPPKLAEPPVTLIRPDMAGWVNQRGAGVSPADDTGPELHELFGPPPEPPAAPPDLSGDDLLFGRFGDAAG